MTQSENQSKTRPMRKRLVIASAAALLSVPAMDTSFAGVAILNTVPMSGATVFTAPRTITLEFTGDVVPGSLGLDLRGPAGKPVATGVPAVGKAKNTVVVPITGPLPDGTFEIAWHVMAPDSSTSSGSFSFTYKP